jgi:hypothetical protein
MPEKLAGRNLQEEMKAMSAAPDDFCFVVFLFAVPGLRFMIVNNAARESATISPEVRVLTVDRGLRNP